MEHEDLRKLAEIDNPVNLFCNDSTEEERVKKGYILKRGPKFHKVGAYLDYYFIYRLAITSIQI